MDQAAFDRLWNGIAMASSAHAFVLCSEEGFAAWLDWAEKATDECIELPESDEALALHLKQKTVLAKLRARDVLTESDFAVMGWDMPQPHD